MSAPSYTQSRWFRCACPPNQQTLIRNGSRRNYWTANAHQSLTHFLLRVCPFLGCRKRGKRFKIKMTANFWVFHFLNAPLPKIKLINITRILDQKLYERWGLRFLWLIVSVFKHKCKFLPNDFIRMVVIIVKFTWLFGSKTINRRLNHW